MDDIIANNQDSKKRKCRSDWTKEEESLFKKAIELHGRDWNKVAKHYGGNRAVKSIRSHAQTYFLKLLHKRKKLPSKVLEKGLGGYMVSGKPLNKYSRTATNYFGCAQNVPMMDGVISDKEAADKKEKKNKNVKKKNVKTRKKKKKSKKKKKKRFLYDDYGNESSDDSSDEGIEVRKVRRSLRINNNKKPRSFSENKNSKNKSKNKNNKQEESGSEDDDMGDFIHVIDVDFDSLYLSKQQILSLKACDKIDYKRVDGKWCAAKIEMIKHDCIIMECIQSKESIMIKINDNNLQARFAVFGSISTRPVTKYSKYQAFPLDYEIKVDGKRCKVIGHEYIEKKNVIRSVTANCIDNRPIPAALLLGQLMVQSMGLDGNEACGSFWIHPDDKKHVQLITESRIPHMPPLPIPLALPSLSLFSEQINHNDSLPLQSRKRFRNIINNNMDGENGSSSPKKRRKRDKKRLGIGLKWEPINAIDLCDSSEDEGMNFKGKMDVGKDLHFSLWTSEDIISWITELEGGRYKPYATRLLATFKRREICGKALSLIESSDLDKWGMANFRDCRCLYNHIQNLIKMS